MNADILINDLAEQLSLDGVWNFRLGDRNNWTKIRVPGCWESQGFAKTIDGPAIYKRKLNIPANWTGKAILARFKAVSYACEVIFNGSVVGSHRGLWTPFTLDLSKVARPGKINSLEIQVFKPGEKYPVRSALAGFLPDVATTFGGIWQPVELTCLDYAIQNLQILPDFDRGAFQIRATPFAVQPLPEGTEWVIKIDLANQPISEKHIHSVIENELNNVVPVANPVFCEPDHPALYRVEVTLTTKEKTLAKAVQYTGFRRLSKDGDQLLLNGRPFMVRGVLSWGWNPEQIAPSYGKEQARAEIRRAHEMGFNLVKLCLFVPNKEYYDVADEEGMLLWQEWPMWQPEVTSEFRENVSDEYADLFELTHSHPSVALYSLGCELNKSVDSSLIQRLDQIARARVKDALICDNSGSGESYGGLDIDTSDFTDYHPYFDLQYLEPLLDNWRRDWKALRPWILGEFCDSDTFRDLDKLKNSNEGKPPWWMTMENPVSTWRQETQALKEAKKRLAAANLPVTQNELIKISYAQALVIRKYTLETIRKRAGIGGYVITGLRDTPIASSGIWDDFGQAKWPAGEFLPINGDQVLCLDTPRRRCWVNGGDRPDPVDPYNLWSGQSWQWHVILGASSVTDLTGAQFQWKLTYLDGSVLAAGQDLNLNLVETSRPQEAAIISCEIPPVNKPTELQLEATLEDSKLHISNIWPIWLYPQVHSVPDELVIFDPIDQLGLEREGNPNWLENMSKINHPNQLKNSSLVLTTTLNSEILNWIEAGGRALLLQQTDIPLPIRHYPFWREAIKVFIPHPLWEAFPQRGYTDLQFWGLASDRSFDTARLAQFFTPKTKLTPILRRLDAREFHISDYLFEAHTGDGILIGCSISLQGGSGGQPIGWKRNVAGSWMLYSLLNILKNS
jgi:hypothetical protein